MAIANISITADRIPQAIFTFYQSGVTPQFVGEPGHSKTAQVRLAKKLLEQHYGEEFGMVELHLSSISEVDIRGYLVINGNKTVFSEPPFWDEILKHKRGIVFLDEYMQADHPMQKATAPFLYEGVIGESRLNDDGRNWLVITAGNGTEDGAGANTMLTHVLGRVCRLNVAPLTPEMWCPWAISEGLPYEAVAFAKLRPEIVFGSSIPEAADTPYPNPRSLHLACKSANVWAGGLAAMCMDDLGRAIIAGHIGMGGLAELAAVVTMAHKITPFEDCMADPLHAPIPSNVSEQYASVMMISTRADATKHRESAIQYLARFNPNIALVGIVGLINRDKQFIVSALAGKWVADNAELIKKFGSSIRMNA